MAPETARPANRPATLPALIYVLAAFGVITGSYGAMASVKEAAMFAKPREFYLAMVTTRNEPFKSLGGAAAIDRFDAREADALYGRRNAALPIAVLGILLSCLTFAGAMRAMRGDSWGLSAWRFAAAASIPYQLVSLLLAVVIARDLSAAIAELPLTVQLYVGAAPLLMSMAFCGVAIVYYGVCVIYLRTSGVRRAFSADAPERTPPSA
jgi:hypothetical protein